MKVSEITAEDVLEYIRRDEPDSIDMKTVVQALSASKAFVRSYTGLDDEQIDEHEDFWIAIMVLCQDMFDNRSYYVDKSNVNKVVDAVLGLHCRNLL